MHSGAESVPPSSYLLIQGVSPVIITLIFLVIIICSEKRLTENRMVQRAAYFDVISFFVGERVKQV